ncbi:hypothetical protein EC988_009384, partial [Linderina pennispora]
MDKWYVVRLPNKSSFIMIMLPNILLSVPENQESRKAKTKGKKQACERSTGSGCSSDGEEKAADKPEVPFVKHRRSGSEPAAAPVFTPALNKSIRGDESSGSATDFSAVNELHAYTLAIECSMESTEMHRHVRARDVRKGPVQRSNLNLRPFSIDCPDTRMRGQSYTGFIGQEDVPIAFTEHAQAEILKLEKMYSEAYMQTVYLALMLGRTVAPADVLAVQQSSLWRKRSIDVDITAFLHSQD